MQLTTKRLILRDVTEDDWRAVHEYAADPEVTRYLPFGPNTEEQTRQFIQRTIQAQQDDPRRKFELGIVLPRTGELIGGCRVSLEDAGNRSGSIGYILHRDHWGRGIMTEAASELLRFGFSELDMHRIWATCDELNVASARVLEKIGMKREGLMREDTWMEERWRSTYLYAVLEQEWRP
ncbi:MAG: GNAT family N-acetyltransferase [Candidatus Brocadiia bacterium]